MAPPLPRTPAALTALLLLAGAASSRAAEAPAEAMADTASGLAADAPRLVLAVSVDQMRADYLDRYQHLYEGGLKRLSEQGAVFANARYRHACTETGPGHSVLLSGRSPRNSGIVGNAWWDRALQRKVNVVDDPTVRVLGGAGRPASPAYYNAFTVGDLLKTRSPRSKVIGVSFKDRAAILMAGKRADGAYWYEGSGGRFVTSSWYRESAPSWLGKWNARAMPDSYAAKSWERLLSDPATYERYAGPDAVKGEWDGKDLVFPHKIRGTPPGVDYYDDLRRTPFADEILLDFALTAMKAHGLAEDDATDLLAISFSACDVIGHTYGPDSQEMLDYLLRLDRTLGRLFDEMDARVGKGRWISVLAADHGVMPLVEVLEARGLPAKRVAPEALDTAVQKALAARYPGKEKFFVDPDPMEYVLDKASLVRQGLDVAEVEATIRQALLDTGVVDAVYTAEELMGPPRPDDPLFDLHQRAFFAPRSGDLVVRTKQYVYLGGRVGGTGHGTPWDYDRHIPIVFLGPGIAAGRHTEACGPEDIAWALGRMLGLPYPQQDSETDLVPMMKPAR
ncbi:MAG TPA: alkaline phosphatase family protein [Vicinamibacteria bacterium]